MEDSDSEAEDDEAIVQRPLAAPGSQGKLGDGNNRVADDPNAQTDNSQALFIEARQQVLVRTKRVFVVLTEVFLPLD